MAVQLPSAAEPLPDQQQLFSREELESAAPTQRAARDVTVGTSEVLRTKAVGCRLSMSQMSTSKALSRTHKAEAAAALGCSENGLSASKRLVDLKHPAIKAVGAVLRECHGYWISVTLPIASIHNGDTLEPGLRLIRRDKVVEFRQRMEHFQEQLSLRAIELQAAMPQIREEARRRLGARVFDENDYPEQVADLFRISWSFPNVEPPSYLAELDPEGYRAECDKVTAQFSSTVELAREVFLAHFAETISHITDRVSGLREVTAAYSGRIAEIEKAEGGWRHIRIEEPLGDGVVTETQKVHRDFGLQVKVGDVVVKGQLIGRSVSGKGKTFKDSMIINLAEQIDYFKRFRELLQFTPDVEQLVKNADSIIRQGLQTELERQIRNQPLEEQHVKRIAGELRSSSHFRRILGDAFKNLNKRIDAAKVVHIRRRITPLRRPNEDEDE